MKDMCINDSEHSNTVWYDYYSPNFKYWAIVPNIYNEDGCTDIAKLGNVKIIATNKDDVAVAEFYDFDKFKDYLFIEHDEFNNIIRLYRIFEFVSPVDFSCSVIDILDEHTKELHTSIRNNVKMTNMSKFSSSNFTVIIDKQANYVWKEAINQILYDIGFVTVKPNVIWKGFDQAISIDKEAINRKFEEFKRTLDDFCITNLNKL